MKRILFAISLFFIGLLNVNAAAVDLYASRTSVTTGEAVVITVKSNDAVGKYSLSSSNGNVLSGGFSAGFRTKGEQATYRFVAKSPGTATITFTPQNMALYSNDQKYTNSSSITIRVYAPRPLSTNNNLSGISIDGATLSPEFNKDTLEYTVSLEPGTEKINVNASLEDSYASLSGTGEKEVVEGDNLIELVVTAESGSTKTYKINANVKEYNPVKVRLDNQEYTVVRNKKNLTPPANYEETTLNINNEEIPAYENKTTKYVLVALKDSNGKQNWYIKDKDNYKLYKEYKFGSTILYPMELEKIPEGYSKTEIKYNEEKIVAYKLKESSKYALIYAMNIETGKTNIYMYDAKEDTVQIYNDEHVNKLIEDNELYLKILIGVSAGLVLCIGIIIFVLIKNRKLKRSING